jgi:UDP-glucose 4-epimerase
VSQLTPGGPLENQRSKTVLVTGAAGFLGSHVAELLSSDGRHDIIATDVVKSERSDAVASLPRVEFRAVDLRDLEALEAAVSGAGSIVHLAAIRTKASSARPREALEINVGATYDLLSLATLHRVRRLVYGSTHIVYGAFQDPQRPYFREDEARVRRGLNMYGASKLASEAFIEAFAQDGGPDYVCLRFGGIYGPRASRDSNGGILLDVLAALDRGARPVVQWARDSRHALVFVEDAARAVVTALESDQANMAVNVVGDPVPAEVLYSTLVRLYGHDPSVIDWQEERTRYQLVSRDRLHSVLGYDPATSLEDGLRAVIDWHRERQS